MQWVLENKVSIKHVTLIKNMYINIMTSIRICGKTNDFSIKIRLHHPD
jgi:hypothetical protein